MAKECWPPCEHSWKLDVVLDLIPSCQLKFVDTDVCMWGARDPGNMLAYKKADAFGQLCRSDPIDQDMQSTTFASSSGRQRVQWRSQRREEQQHFWRIPNSIYVKIGKAYAFNIGRF